MQRPPFSKIKTGKDFNQWYWLKSEMQAICKQLNLPSSGKKFDLRDRIMYALDHKGQQDPKAVKAKPKSTFKWSKATLTPQTLITDNITFGQNLRRFMQAHIGERFAFNIDFMAWAKANAVKTLQDAIDQWKFLEDRKKDPSFKTEIADHNMMNQYFRDFMEDNPNASIEMARRFWRLKKQQPMKDGFVRYEKGDLKLK